jgi:hypothetical protein
LVFRVVVTVSVVVVRDEFSVFLGRDAEKFHRESEEQTVLVFPGDDLSDTVRGVDGRAFGFNPGEDGSIAIFHIETFGKRRLGDDERV